MQQCARADRLALHPLARNDREQGDYIETQFQTKVSRGVSERIDGHGDFCSIAVIKYH